jgi:hypothetical protein
MTDEKKPEPKPLDPAVQARVREYQAATERAMACPEEMHEALFIRKKCPAPTELLKGVPMGMFHCGVCGSMVIAGVSHPEVDPPWDPEINQMAHLFYKEHPELLNRRKMHLCVLVSDQPFEAMVKNYQGYTKVVSSEVDEQGDMRYKAAMRASEVADRLQDQTAGFWSLHPNGSFVLKYLESDFQAILPPEF